MEISQRGSSAFTAVATTTTYTLDRWCYYSVGTNLTITPTTTGGPTGLPYYAAIKSTSTSSNTWYFAQSLETFNVNMLQGQTVTVSFWYKTPVVFTNAVLLKMAYSTGTDANLLNVGTGITPSAGTNVNTSTGAITNNTAWTQAQATFAVPATATSLVVQFSSATNIVNTAEFDVTGVQLEIGSTATQFSRTGGTIQGELAQCQRYYWRNTGVTGGTGQIGPLGRNTGTTTAQYVLIPSVTMRRVPSAVEFANLSVDQSATVTAISAITIGTTATTMTFPINCTSTGLTSGALVGLAGPQGASSYLGFTAEL
jgi:hypothetical protein